MTTSLRTILSEILKDSMFKAEDGAFDLGERLLDIETLAREAIKETQSLDALVDDLRVLIEDIAHWLANPDLAKGVTEAYRHDAELLLKRHDRYEQLDGGCP